MTQNGLRKTGVQRQIRRLLQPPGQTMSKSKQGARHGNPKTRLYLWRFRCNRISWQIVDVGARMHIHALKSAGLW